MEKMLLRYISSHISEYLELSDQNNFEAVHNLEFYIKPPIKTKIFTGDIVKCKKDNSLWVILTPACDLATDENRRSPKAKLVTLALIMPFERIVNGRAIDEITKLKSNNLDLKYHYLPQTVLFGGGFINFQHVISVPIKAFTTTDEFNVECVITNSFRKDIISRFANYYSRQGQPTFS